MTPSDCIGTGCKAESMTAQITQLRAERDEARDDWERINAVCDDGQLSDVSWERDSAEVERDAYKARAERAEAERDEALALLRGVTEVHPRFHYDAEIGKHTPYVELRFAAADWESRNACARAIDAALAALKGDEK